MGVPRGIHRLSYESNLSARDSQNTNTNFQERGFSNRTIKDPLCRAFHRHVVSGVDELLAGSRGHFYRAKKKSILVLIDFHRMKRRGQSMIPLYVRADRASAGLVSARSQILLDILEFSN